MNLRLLWFVIFLFSSDCFLASSDSGSSVLRYLIQAEWVKGKIEKNTKEFNESCVAREQELQAESDKFFDLDYESLRKKASYGKVSSKSFYRKLHKELPVTLDVIALEQARVDVWEAGIVLAERKKFASKLSARRCES